MTFADKLAAIWSKNNSLVCVGLDPDLGKMPAAVVSMERPLFAFNKAIIDATSDLVCAYKPNSAFYEAYGTEGLQQLHDTLEYIHAQYPEIPTIVDAKRGDIGNTNDGYVKHTFDYLGADAITVHPYLGKESLAPFLAQTDKGIIVLCRTSNPGAGEFQDLLVDGRPLYEYIAKQVAEDWNTLGNCLLVIGGTYADEMKTVRDLVGSNMTFLVPGIGAQGGDIEAAVNAGKNDAGTGMIINSSRGIIYASNGSDFAEAARAQTVTLRDEINNYR